VRSPPHNLSLLKEITIRTCRDNCSLTYFKITATWDVTVIWYMASNILEELLPPLSGWINSLFLHTILPRRWMQQISSKHWCHPPNYRSTWWKTIILILRYQLNYPRNYIPSLRYTMAKTSLRVCHWPVAMQNDTPSVKW
jgi:hypothetical protein